MDAPSSKLAMSTIKEDTNLLLLLASLLLLGLDLGVPMTVPFLKQTVTGG